MITPKMIDIESSLIRKIGYDKDNQELHIIFLNDEHYIYSEVPIKIFVRFVNIESKDLFFRHFIKKNGRLVSETKEWFGTKIKRQGLSLIDKAKGETIAEIDRTFELRSDEGRLLFIINATVLNWIEGAFVDDFIKETDDCMLTSLTFSFPKEAMYVHLPKTRTIVDDFVNKFNSYNGHPLAKFLNLNLKNLMTKLKSQKGFEAFYLPEWLLTDSTQEGVVDIERVHAFNKYSNETDLSGFAKAYCEYFAKKRNEADQELLKWCDLVVFS